MSAWIDDFAAGIGAGFIGGAIFVACFRPTAAALIIHWVLS